MKQLKNWMKSYVIIFQRDLRLLVQAALIICGLFICDFAYMGSRNDLFSVTYPLIISHPWSFYMQIHYMRVYFWSPYPSHITRSNCIGKTVKFFCVRVLCYNWWLQVHSVNLIAAMKGWDPYAGRMESPIQAGSDFNNYLICLHWIWKARPFHNYVKIVFHLRNGTGFVSQLFYRVVRWIDP
jgi:hypothetical protein